MKYETYMNEALLLAQKAYDLNETPIGAIVVLNDEIIGSGYNIRNSGKNVLYHAEIIAINEACQKINDWRLEDATIFSTIEPCPMCAGAIVQARIKELVFGAPNNKFGSCGSVINILDVPNFNHRVSIISGVLEEKCAAIMKDFFKKFR